MSRFIAQADPKWIPVMLCSLGCLFPLSSSGQIPEWIWHSSTNAPNDELQTVYFRKTFRTPALLWNSRLIVSADDKAEVFLNAVPVARCERWDHPVRAEVTVRLNQGENVLAVKAQNREGPPGLLVQLNLGGQTNLVSDGSWLVATREEPGWPGLAFNAAHWAPARSLGTHGVAPWGEILLRATATSAEALTVIPGFKVELLRSAGPDEGSWICLAFDDRGRLFLAPEGDQRPLLRCTFQNGGVSAVDIVPAPIRFAMGLLHTQGSLYANARGPGGPGLYRLTDANANDQFDPDELALLKNFEGSGEHGYHALRLGPDGKIYIVNGNGTKLPKGLSAVSPHQSYGQDVLSLNPDETTEVSAQSAVQCHILRTDLEGKQWDLWAGGMRNVYAFDFSSQGELFAFDSDMEWDWGTPWYQPTRILHVVSGGDYGWRDGTRTWPDWYEDSLPAAVNVGIGSPTGVRFGASSHFPTPYRQALFAMDWSYGRILAVHLTPAGASYAGRFETFLQGTPLNLTDLAFGPDGALYFLTGGRGTQSGLYRVSYTGAQAPARAVSTAPGPALDSPDSTALRRRLERFHGRREPGAVDSVWPHLGSDDRFLRYAARIALESQDLTRWRVRALAETNAGSALTALLALARVGPPECQRDLFHALERFPLEGLPDRQQLVKLRVIQVSLLRQGKPRGDGLHRLVATLHSRYPASTWPLNRELSRLLIYLEVPDVVPRTLELLATAPTQEEQFHYVAQLRNLKTGWSLGDRRRFFEWWLKPRLNLERPPELLQWFADVGRNYVDGAYVDRYLREFRADAIAALSPDERTSLAELIEQPFQKAQLVPSSNRNFVQEWTVPDLLPNLEQGFAGRNFESGRQAFVDAQCIACHRFGNDGGSVGPELTGAGSKYDRRSLLESILEPSKVVSEQYQNVTVSMRDGDSFSGRVVRESADQIVLETDPLSGARENLARNQVNSIEPAALSPMPEGLANILTREEILDLVAYLESGGRADAGLFRPP